MKVEVVKWSYRERAGNRYCVNMKEGLKVVV